jgi:predicted small metal-binding protein
MGIWVFVGLFDGRPSDGAGGCFIRAIPCGPNSQYRHYIHERRTAMKVKILLATLVIALMVSFATSASAREKSVAKKTVAEVKSVSCNPECGFMVQSHDEKELTDIVIAHAKNAHNMDVTASDVKAKMKTVGAKEVRKSKS